MKRFRFSLQSVLAVRKAKADQVAATLAERQRSRRASEERLRVLRAASAAALAELTAGGRAGSGPSDLSAYQSYLRGLADQIRAVEAQVADAQAEEAKLRNDLVGRMKEERMIKQLRTRKLKTYQSVAAREAQGEIDEVARAGWTARASRESEL